MVDIGGCIYLANDNGTNTGAVRLRTAYNAGGTLYKPNFAIDRSTNAVAYGGDPSTLTYVNSMTIDGDTGNVGIGTTTPSEKLEINGNLFLNADNNKLYLGAGKDASIYYDGTDLIIDPKVVGSGSLNLNGGNLTTTGTITGSNLSGTNTGDQVLPTRDSLGLDTDDSPQFAGIELGNASDTTITRSAAGVIAVESVVIPSISSTNTLTNKRITARITTITSDANPTINTDDCDAVTITAQAADIASMTTNLSGTPTNFQKLIIRIKDDGTARAITWGASYEAKGVVLPTTTVISKVLTVGFIYDTVTSKWGCVASAQEA